MELSYENTLDDVVALLEYQTARSRPYQRRRRMKLYWIPILLVLICSFGAVMRMHQPVLVIIPVLVGIYYHLRYRHLYRKHPRAFVEKQQREKPQQEVLCRHAITVSAEGFSEETPGSRYFHTWQALAGIEFTPDHLFVFQTPAMVAIIPRRELSEVQFHALADELRRLLAAREAPA
jgi:hypothetical protein